MIYTEEKKLIIVSKGSKVTNFTNENCPDAAKISDYLSQTLGCTYFIYMHENLITNEKSVYTSRWDWQELLINEMLINNCPIFKAAFSYLESRPKGEILVPWYTVPASNKSEREICGLRADFNIANGYGYAAKGYGVRETLAFAGEPKHTDFYKQFLVVPTLFPDILKRMRLIVLTKNHQHKFLHDYRETKT